MIRTLILLAVVFAMSGCMHQPQVIEKTTIKYVVLDDTWLAPCVMVAPPDRMTYVAQSERQKADSWARKYLDQAGLNGDCNVRLKTARDYNRKKAAETSTITCTDGVCK